MCWLLVNLNNRLRQSERPDKRMIEMEEILWRIGKLILMIVGFIGFYIGLLWFTSTNYYLHLLRWVWSILLGVSGFVSLGFMIESIDFYKPIFLSVYWSTLGYLVLAIVLWLLAIGTFLTKYKFKD